MRIFLWALGSTPAFAGLIAVIVMTFILTACTPQQRADALSGAVFGALNGIAAGEAVRESQTLQQICDRRRTEALGGRVAIDIVDPDLDAACDGLLAEPTE